jgi:hypothetical protein
MAKKGSLGVRVTGEWGRHLKKENKRLAHRKERTIAKRITKKEIQNQ